MTKLVYIAGPFRGKSHFAIAENIRNAERAALNVWALACAYPGLAALCPHANTAHFQDALPDRVWLEGDLSMLYVCDAVLLVEGWERSSGARKEYEEAKARNIPCFTDIYELGKHYGLSSHMVAECLARKVEK